MSMINKLVKELRWIAEHEYQKRNSEATIREAADTIEALSAKLARHNLGYDAWIPVGERLPSGQENVIVTIYDDHGDTPWEYTTNAWHIDSVWIADNDIVCGSVVAWMPLPEPYKRGDANVKEADNK